MKASRRAILRASLAAPIVLTVTTAQAQTAASSAVACVRRDDLRAADPSLRPAQLLTVDGDDWLRTELSLVRIEQLIGVEWVLVDGEHFLGYGGSIYWRLVPSSVGFSAAITSFTQASTRVREVTRSVFALVYVNPVGQVTGYAAQLNGGAAVTASCLVSAAPGTVLPGGSRVTAQSRRTQSSVMWRRSQ